MRNFMHLLLPVLLLTGCRVDPAEEIFQDAESLMASAPDSAMRLLEGIDPATLGSRALRARHALLRSQALDKNGIDLRSDSVIAPAAAYYARHGSKRERAYMHYYLGRIRSNAGRVGEAAEAMMAAEKYAEPCGETYLLGLIYNCRANLYYSQYSLEEALQMYDKADSCFRLEGKTVFEGYMAKAKATTYALMKNFPASQAEYEKALNIFDSIGNHQQVCLISSSLAVQMKNHNQLPTSDIKRFLKETYRRHTSGVIPSIDYPIWAGIYLEENKLDSARYFCNRALSISPKTINQRCGIVAVLSEIEEKARNYYNATLQWKENYFLLDSISRYEKENLIQRIEERYENKELHHRNQMLHLRNRSYIYIGALIMTLLIGIFTRILRRRQEIIRKQREEVNQRQAYIEALNENFETVKGLYEELLKNTDSRSEEEAKVLKSVEKRLNGMKDLLNVAYSVGCSPQILYKKFKDYATGMKKEEDAFSDLRHVLNRRYNGFIDHFLQLHPKLTSTEKNWIYMLLYGFSSDSIRFIYGHENPATYYSRKYKLRRKVGVPSKVGEKFEAQLAQMAKEFKAAKEKESASCK